MKTIKGNTLSIDCDKDDTIKRIKELIAQKIDESLDGYFLYYAGKCLDKDELKVIDYEIKKESTLTLVIRVKGGK